MASILRSAKFVRYVAGFARNIVINPPREFDGSIIQSTQCLCGGLQRSLATQVSSQHSQHDQNLDRCLRRLDQDVRRSGRISRRDIEDILEEIRHTRSATSSQSLLVIRCCGNLVPEELPETRTKLVQEIWNTLHKLNVPMDISHYNALLRVYLENEHPFSPTDFLSDLEARGIEPNRVTYQRLISRYCQLGDIEGATRILEFMREKQLPINENVFNALIMGHSNSDDMESAKGILSVMQQAGLEPSADTYTTLLSGYARRGDIDSIKSILEECESKEVYLLDKDYLDIIFSLAVNSHNEHVPFILSKVRKSVGYNQDATNLILRLINYGKEEAALEILTTIPTEENTGVPNSNLLVRQMVKAERPVEKIIHFCRHLQKTNLNDKALLYAIEMSLKMGKDKAAYALLEDIQKDGIIIKPHFFWPLLVSKGKQNDEEGMLKVLEKMRDFNLIVTNETLRDYVLPYVSGSVDQIISKLCAVGLSTGTVASNVLHKYLFECDIKNAVEVASRMQAYYSPAVMKRPLAYALLKTQDVKSYIKIVRAIHDNFDRRDSVFQRDESEESAPKSDVKEIVGALVLEILYANSKVSTVLIEQVLNGLVNEGLSVSTNQAEKIQERLEERMTPEISGLLGKLSSGELTPIQSSKSEQPHYVPSSAMNSAQLERLISNLEAKNENTSGLQRQLLTLYVRDKELEKSEALLQKLSNTDFKYSSGVYAQLVDLYAHHDKLPESLQYYQKLKELDKDTPLDSLKLIKLVNLLIKNDRFDEALDILNKEPVATKTEQSFQYSGVCWRTLNLLAEQNKPEQLKKLTEVLLEKDLMTPNNVLLGPLIKVHLLNDNVEKALEEFESVCTKYRCTPWKNEITCRLIQCEDADKLQKLTDLSTSIHGEVNSLYDLVFAFVECGRIRQARKILETPGLQKKPQRLSLVCERYREEGKVKPLEGLVEATRNISYIDRSDIYNQLLLSYISKDDSEKALGLWTQMQEENVQPSDTFLHKLATYLKSKNLEVPFVEPKTETNVQPTERVNSPVKSLSVFRQALKEGDVEEALKLRNQPGSNLNSTDLSLLLEALVKAERLNEATKVCIDMLERNMTPVPRIFRFFLNKIANTGDVDRMERIGNKLSSDIKKVLSFDNRLCHANIVAGKANDYLDILIKEIDHAKDDQVSILAEKFPRGGAVGILEKCLDLIPKYESLAEKYAKRGVIAPMNVLWAEYFINNDTESANRIWSTYLADTPRIMFQRVVQLARENKDEQLIKRLIEHLKSSKVSEGAIGNAYSCLLDVLVLLEKNQEVTEAFQQAVKDVNLEYINRTALLRVKDVHEKLNKPFTHQIPMKNAKSATSSSSSEEDKKC